jgi:tetrahydromethanopterin S-methyltransferase subunit D
VEIDYRLGKRESMDAFILTFIAGLLGGAIGTVAGSFIYEILRGKR